jgi:hypothetical protein
VPRKESDEDAHLKQLLDSAIEAAVKARTYGLEQENKKLRSRIVALELEVQEK